jgi:hypothetical protein
MPALMLEALIAIAEISAAEAASVIANSLINKYENKKKEEERLSANDIISGWPWQ